jgi:erythronate-4-phosphate dehydrogenase
MMKIIIDDKIPYINGVLEPYFEVVYLSGRETTKDVISDADALITRTRTSCSRENLAGSKVKYIATATAGYDHIDAPFCAEAGIKWSSAPGCNAESVNQYIASALFAIAQRRGVTLNGMSIGIVGAGQVGSRVARTCQTLGMNVLLNDPPRERAEGPEKFVSLQDVMEQADIFTFHVPLTMNGADKTHHMIDFPFLQGFTKCPVLINTSRGEIFNTAAVKRARSTGVVTGLVIDCWEQEPDLDLGLLHMADLGTPHIAGYSRDGKARGTTASVRAVSRFFGLGIDDWEPSSVESPTHPLIEINGLGKSGEELLAEAVLATYPIDADDQALRDQTELFEQLRGGYPVRREFSAHVVSAVNVEVDILNKLARLGFKVCSG